MSKAFMTIAMAALIGAASGAEALTVDLTVNARDAASYVFAGEGGVSVTAASGQFRQTDPVFTAGGVLTFNQSTGLGVDTGLGDSVLVDGFNGNDGVRFSFSDTIRLLSVTFANADNNDDFRFFSENAQGVLTHQGGARLSSGTFSTYAFAQNWVGSVFGFAAFDNDDSFRIASISYSVVPLPGAFLLLGAGAAALLVVGSRGRRAAA